jgi:hypothetical protein
MVKLGPLQDVSRAAERHFYREIQMKYVRILIAAIAVCLAIAPDDAASDGYGQRISILGSIYSAIEVAVQELRTYDPDVNLEAYRIVVSQYNDLDMFVAFYDKDTPWNPPNVDGEYFYVVLATDGLRVLDRSSDP